jgi:hypothetical protein
MLPIELIHLLSLDGIPTLSDLNMLADVKYTLTKELKATKKTFDTLTATEVEHQQLLKMRDDIIQIDFSELLNKLDDE